MQLFRVPIKPLKLRKEIRLWEKPVNNSYVVAPVRTHDNSVPQVMDCLHMSWGDIARSADQRHIVGR